MPGTVHQFPVNFTTHHHQSPISPIYSPYELSSPYSTTSTASSFLTDNSSISDAQFDSPTSPDEHATDYSVYSHHTQAFNSQGELSSAYELEYALWAEPKKPSNSYHIPRSQPAFVNSYQQHATQVKVAPYIAPPIPPHQRVANQVPIHSPIPTHPLHQQRLEAAQQQGSQSVGEVNQPVYHDETWSQGQQLSAHYAPHTLVPSHQQPIIVSYSASLDLNSPSGSPTSVPRIKKEDSPAHPSYASAHADLLAQQHHASRTASASYEAVAVSNTQDPTQTYNLLSSFDAQASISASQTQPSPEYYSPSYHQPSPSQTVSRSVSHQSSAQDLQAQAAFHQQAANFDATTVHPSEVTAISPTSSGSPLSSYGDHALSPHGIHDGSWPVDRRPSMSSVASDIPVGGVDMDGIVGGVDVSVVAGMEVVVGMSSVEGSVHIDDDAEGEEEWDHSALHATCLAHGDLIYHHQNESDSDAASDHEILQGRSRTKRESGSDVDLAVSSEDEFDETSSEEEEDDDDDEFVLNPRQRRSKTVVDYKRRRATIISTPTTSLGPSSYPSANGEGCMSYTSEGRSLRPRSSTTRYNPYGYSDVGGYVSASDYGNAHVASGQNGDAYERRRYNSTSASSSASPSISSSHSGSTNITTTSTSRRRIRPSPSLPVPVPIPNLTKKSRGRRVPTMTSLEDIKSSASGAGKKRQSPGGRNARMYLCDVEGCGKCFARGEHLKRHVRSIHTYEKPHKCPYPGCGKDFSRHDNLGQHMRVHKDFVTPPSTAVRKKAQQA